MARILVAIIGVDGTEFDFTDDGRAHTSTYINIPDDQVRDVVDALQNGVGDGLATSTNLRLSEITSDRGPMSADELIKVVHLNLTRK